MSEAGMRSYLVKKLQSLDAVPIESRTTGIGIPDVNCTCGWIECKWLRSWPKNCQSSPVKFQHDLTKEQQIWLWRRVRRGGRAYVMAKVSREWFLWDGHIFKEHGLWNSMTKAEMINWSRLHFSDGLDSKRLIAFLKENVASSSAED